MVDLLIAAQGNFVKPPGMMRQSLMAEIRIECHRRDIHPGITFNPKRGIKLVMDIRERAPMTIRESNQAMFHG